MGSVKISDWDSSFIKGSNSSLDPTQLPLGYLWNTINMLTVSGVTGCRPGHRCIVKFPKGNLQGATVFRPILGLEQMLVAVDGVIYVAEYPFKNFHILTNVLMSATAKQIFWKQAVQSVERITPGDQASAVRVIPPRAVVFIQDGGITAPAFYDGSASGHIRDLPFQTPAGGPMEWIGDRLWVANGNQVFASDISNPFSFVEQVYLGGTSSFNFASDVTAMTQTPSVEFPQLIIYTEDDVSIIQADIRKRDLWPDTNGFQRSVLKVGCPSNRAVVSNFGVVTWLSQSGVVFFDFAVAARNTSRVPIRDNEMLYSKTTLSNDLSLATMGVFGQWVVMSVPAEDRYNKHTWVLNSASWETITDQGGTTWNGYWLGTRPVEWVYGKIAGAERIYHVSIDEDEENRLWESFLPERLDNGCPIMWAAFTRGYFGQSAQVKKPGRPVRFMYADVALAGVEENLDLGVFVAPGSRGQFHRILTKRISASRGSLSPDQLITATTKLFAFKPQTRTERTVDFSEQKTDPEDGSCPVESDFLEGVEESFQMLVVGHGPATLRYIRPYANDKEDEDESGEPEACQNEPEFNAVRFDGAGARADDIESLTEELAERPLDRFIANKTALVEIDGFSAVGVGFSESIVSQQAADRVAEIIANKMAEVEVLGQIPPVLSIGEGFNE